jgi:DNA-binding transcriptional MerR regulator
MQSAAVVTYKLEELAEQAGVSPRTVRYYVQRGLLPAPEFRGKDTSYGHEHLLRLRAIKRLQQAHLPLDEIQVRLHNAKEEDLLRIARTAFEVSPRKPFDEPIRDTGAGKLGQHPSRFPDRDEPFDAPKGHSPLPRGAAEVARVFRLAKGVELWVREGASPAARALVREILSQFATNPDDE